MGIGTSNLGGMMSAMGNMTPSSTATPNTNAQPAPQPMGGKGSGFPAQRPNFGGGSPEPDPRGVPPGFQPAMPMVPAGAMRSTSMMGPDGQFQTNYGTAPPGAQIGQKVADEPQTPPRPELSQMFNYRRTQTASPQQRNPYVDQGYFQERMQQQMMSPYQQPFMQRMPPQMMGGFGGYGGYGMSPMMGGYGMPPQMMGGFGGYGMPQMGGFGGYGMPQPMGGKGFNPMMFRGF
jgi:hypothetical protein